MRQNHQLQMDFNQILIVTGIIATIVGSAIGILKLHYMRQDRKPKFVYEKFPQNDIWCVRILHPDKLITKCSVSCEGRPLSLSRLRDTFECSIEAGSGENFLIPIGSWKDDSEIVIKYDNHKIKKEIQRDSHSN